MREEGKRTNKEGRGMWVWSPILQPIPSSGLFFSAANATTTTNSTRPKPPPPTVKCRPAVILPVGFYFFSTTLFLTSCNIYHIILLSCLCLNEYKKGKKEEEESLGLLEKLFMLSLDFVELVTILVKKFIIMVLEPMLVTLVMRY